MEQGKKARNEAVLKKPWKLCKTMGAKPEGSQVPPGSYRDTENSQSPSVPPSWCWEVRQEQEERPRPSWHLPQPACIPCIQRRKESGFIFLLIKQVYRQPSLCVTTLKWNQWQTKDYVRRTKALQSWALHCDPTKCDYFAIKKEELYITPVKQRLEKLHVQDWGVLGWCSWAGQNSQALSPTAPHTSCLKQLPAMPADATSVCSEVFYTNSSWIFSSSPGHSCKSILNRWGTFS